MEVILKILFKYQLLQKYFGGSIFSACDPFFPIMYYHIFKKRKLVVWVKNAEIQYLNPARSSLKLNF